MSWHLRWFRLAIPVVLAFVAAVALSAPVPAPEEKDPRSAEEVRRALDDLRALQALAGDPKADPEEPWRAWHSFQLMHAGTAQWKQALDMMAKARSPLDRLQEDEIPPVARTPGMPNEVVAALGGNRGMHRGMVGFVGVSGDGRTLVSNCYGVHFWDAETLSQQITTEHSFGPMTLSQDGKAMVTCGKNDDGHTTFLCVWDLSGREPKVRATLPGRGRLFFQGMALAADNKTLLTAEREGDWPEYPKCIRVWDISSEKPKELPPLPISAEAVGRHDVVDHLVCARSSLTFVDMGGPKEAAVRVWDLDKNPPRLRCCVPAWSAGNPPGPMAISPDGKVLAIRHIRDQAIILWDVSGAKPDAIDRFDAGRYSALSFLPSGNVLAWADRDGWLILRPLNADGRSEVKAEEGQSTVAIPLGFKPLSMAFTDDGKTGVIGGEDHIIHIWDLEKRKERFPPSGHRGRIKALAFSPDGKTLVSAGEEGSVRFWDLTGAAGKQVAVLTENTKTIAGLAFAPDGKSLVSWGQAAGLAPDLDVRLWDLTGKEPRQKAVWQPHRFGTRSVAVSPAGDLMVTAGADGTASFGENWHGCLRLWGLSADPPVQRAALDFQDKDGDGKAVTLPAADHAAFDARGKTLGVLTGENTLRLFDVTDKGLTPGPTLQPFARALGNNTWALSPDGMTLATSGTGPPEKLPEDKGQLSLWRRDGDAIKPWPGFTPIPWEGYDELVFSPDGRRVVGINLDGDLLVYDVPSGDVAYQWKGAGATRLAFAPDGRHLAVGGGNGVIYILRLKAPS